MTKQTVRVVFFRSRMNGAGNSFFGEALRFFFFRADLNDRRAVVLDTGFARELWLLVDINVIDFHFRRQIRVLIELIFRRLRNAWTDRSR